MTPPRSFLVIGPESSGTKMATRILLAADGCRRLPEQAYLDLSKSERFEEFYDEGDLVVHRSVPYADTWEHIPTLIDQLDAHAAFAAAVVVIRSWPATVDSQLRHGHARTPNESEDRTRRALAHIFQGMLDAGAPFVVVTYAGMAYDQQLLLWLYSRLGLTPPATLPQIEDRNAKHYARLA